MLPLKSSILLVSFSEILSIFGKIILIIKKNKMEESPEKSWAKTMLKLDLEMQSGAIWTDEKSQLQKEQKSDPADENPFPINESDDDGVYYDLGNGTRINMDNIGLPHILMPDPIYYGNHKIIERVQLLK